MTIATYTDATPVARDRVRWTDLTWVAWRQHRLMLVGTTALVVVGAAMMVSLGGYAVSSGTIRAPLFVFESLTEPARMLAVAVMLYGALVAVFWAAPLLSREYEQRTHLLVWSQDVSAARWLTGKVVLLATTAVVLGLVLGGTAQLMLHQYNAVPSEYPPFNLFSSQYFEAVPLVQAGYALFGFALGLVVSMITRRTVLSMGLTLGLYFVVRAVIGLMARPHYQTPVRSVIPFDAQGRGYSIPFQTLSVDSGLLNASGGTMDFPRACNGGYSDSAGYYNCLRANGAVANYRDFQPGERIATFQLIEFGIFAVLAVALFFVAWRLMRRTTRL